MATKNVIMRYFRDKLKMDDETRNNIEINKIFPSKNPESKIMYIQCTSTDETSKITSLAKNIEHSNLKDQSASITIHIPKIMYSRYIDLEKLMFQLRKSSTGNIQTNICLGKSDFIIRQKLKQDNRKWKDFVPLQIPPHISKPNLELLEKNNDKLIDEEHDNELYNNEDKDDNEEEQTEDQEDEQNEENYEEEEQDESQEEENNSHRMEDDNELDDKLINNTDDNIIEDNKTLTDTTGSVSNKLKKHKRSPQNDTTVDKRKKIIPDEYNDEIDAMTEEIDTQQPAIGQDLIRTPSITAIMKKIPDTVNFTKINKSESSIKNQS